jgi:uncharacterized protein (TIGR03437 family)
MFGPTVPAKPGEVIILWGTGFGPTDPPAPAGFDTPSTAAYNTSAVSATVGSAPATVYGAALAPGFAGLYQIAIQIPVSLANGDYPVVATISGAQSPSTTLITVRQQKMPSLRFASASASSHVLSLRPIVSTTSVSPSHLPVEYPR